jgi:hypothetical protein
VKFDGPMAVLGVEGHIGLSGQLRNDGWLTSEKEVLGRRRPWRPPRQQLPLRLQHLKSHDLKKVEFVKIILTVFFQQGLIVVF